MLQPKGESISTRTTRRTKHPFYGRFRLGDQLVQPGDTAARPAVFSATDTETKQRVIVKRWTRRKGEPDLEIIWRNEVRLLQALSAYPGGREYLVPLVESGQDANHFLLALGAGARSPLSMLRPVRATPDESTRLHIWRNVRRLAKGLGILHAHGLVHRNIDPDTVLTSQSTAPDFQLSGFEWSIRLREDQPNRVTVGADSDNPASVGHFSFRSDWQALGILVADLLHLPTATLPAAVVPDATAGLTVQERHFIHDLLAQGMMDVHTALNRIDQIVGDHRASARQRVNARLFLIYDDNTQHALWNHVRRARADDETRNESTLRSDLRRCTLLELKQRAPLRNQLALRGRELTYYLKEYGSDGWVFPRIDRIEREQPPARFVVRHQVLSADLLEIRTPFRTEHERNKVAARAEVWGSAFDQDAEVLYPDPAARDVYDAFVVLHLLELLYHAAHVWPITVERARQDRGGGYTFAATAVSDTNLGLLSRSLELGDPVKRLDDLLERDQGNARWQVTLVNGSSGKPDSDRWKFTGVKESGSRGLVFHFTGSKWFNPGQRLRLQSTDGEGHEKLMRRRVQLLDALKEHSELTEMLAKPLLSGRPSHDPPPFDSKKLDKSKQVALRHMCATLPFYVLQGPPGTGKTHLITELVKQRTALDSTARLLITSQGHDAVDHLMREVVKAAKTWNNTHAPLIVRSRGSEDGDLASQAKRQAADIVAKLRSSDLNKCAPENLQQQLEQLQSRIDNAVEPRIPDKPLESLLLRSANIVFSSTNSADLKLLLDSLARFDWSLIEEAGRATGNELLAPLMLSHRRLLIGDSKQLPPFGEERIMRLLAKPQQLQTAFQHGQPLIKRQLGALDVEYLFQRHADPGNVARLSKNVEKALHLFDSLHRDTFGRNPNRPVAGQLKEQYRMHPALARIVSHVFYDRALETADELRALRRQDLKPFHYVRHADKLDAPMVMVCTPYAQVVHGQKYEEKGPAYHNPSEVDAVIEVLASVRAKHLNNAKPSLVVLTPYNEQATQLARRIGIEMKGRLAHLKEFALRDPVVHTIDSFQGDEADIVVASLVRNNARGWYKGLGILGDSRRMNVLLSRAKWTTILVGSLDFLKRRFPPNSPVPEETGLRFLKRLVKVLSNPAARRERRANPVSVVPIRSLIRGRSQ